MNRCNNCRYCHMLKQLLNKEWIIKSVCTVFIQTELNSDYDNFALVVNADIDCCEMFTHRRGLRAKMGVLEV